MAAITPLRLAGAASAAWRFDEWHFPRRPRRHVEVEALAISCVFECRVVNPCRPDVAAANRRRAFARHPLSAFVARH